MSKNNDLSKEFKALGNELATALKQIRSSKEFMDLEKEIGKSVKGISSSLARSFKAAKESPSTSKIKKRLKRVASAGAVKGTAEAKKIRVATILGLKKILKNIKTASKRLDQ